MKITGIVTVKVNGKLLRSKDGASLEFGGKERSTVVANGLVVGYTEKTVPAKVEATIAHSSDTDVIALNDTAGATILFETDSGIAYMIANAHVTKPCKLTGGEGELSFEAEGEPAVPN